MKIKLCLPFPAAPGVVLLTAAFLAVGSSAPAQDQTPPPAASPAPSTATKAPADEAQTPAPAATDQAAATATTAGTQATEAGKVYGTSTNGLNLNFRNAPIDLVLEHLSKAAGFIIQLQTPVHGTVSVLGQDLTKDEVVDLLNSELNKNGYAAIRSGPRTLRIMDKASAKNSSNPVRTGNSPEDVPDNDEIATWIIPIRFVEASQLVSDISPFVSSQATIIANQAGNSIIITDVQANIRHLVEIIKSIDSSAEDATEVRVFKLQYADPTEMANLLGGLFQDQNNGASAPIRFGGGRGGRGGGGGGGNGGFGGFGGGGGRGGFGGFNPFAAAFGAQNATGNPQQDRIKKRNQVVAVADPRTTSIVVTATRDLMTQIEGMISDLDKPGRVQRMEVIRINNADPSEVLQVLQDTVGATTSRNRNTQSSQFEQRIQQNQNNNNSVFSTSGSLGGGQRRN